MIKKENNVCSLIPYTATVNEEIHLVTDKERFEKQLLNNLKRRAYNVALKNNKRVKFDEINVSLPTIIYTENSLTPEQQTRLNFMNTFNSLTLDEAINYVMHEIEPTSVEYVIYKLKEENLSLSTQVASLYEENQLLITQNLEIMTVLVDLYENSITGGE